MVENIENEIPERIFKKLQLLMNLHENASCPAEADNAMARINEVLTRYNLSMMQFQNRRNNVTPESKVEFQKGSFDEFQTPYDGDFAKNLLTILCVFNFCKLVVIPSRDPRSKGMFIILGEKHNITVVNYMFNYCLNHIKIFFNEYWEQVEDKTKKNKKKRAFYTGAVVALAVRLEKQRKESEEIHGVESMNALIKYNNDEIEEKMNEMFPDAKNASSKKFATDNDAMREGYSAGEKIPLNKGLTGSSTTTSKPLGYQNRLGYK